MFDFTLVAAVMPALAKGMWLTLKLTMLVLVVGMVLALPVAVGRNSAFAPQRWVSNAYIMFFRGTPALVQLFLLYYGAGQFEWLRTSPFWPVLRDPFWCVVLALGLNSAAYTGKTLSAALKAVPVATREAARVLGLSRRQCFWLVDLPQAIRLALPAFGNEMILTCKATALASTVTLLELTGSARLATSQTYAPFEVFLAAGLLYLALNYVLMAGMRRLEVTLRHSH